MARKQLEHKAIVAITYDALDTHKLGNCCDLSLRCVTEHAGHFGVIKLPELVRWGLMRWMSCGDIDVRFCVRFVGKV